MFWRVASHVASAEKESDRKHWTVKFYDLMSSLRFLPNSPTLVNAGKLGKGSLSACFVVSPEDTMDSIMQTATESAMIQKWGGGVGSSFSKLRPKNDNISTTHGMSCGPLAILRLYSQVGKTLTQGAFRLSALMGQLICSHPDIQEFIHVKDNDDTLSNFNISVQLTDEFMHAVKQGKDWPLINPRNNQVVRTVKANDLWNEICESAWRTGDPGVAFMDRVWESAPNPQIDRIQGSNPCWSGDTKIWTINGPQKFVDLVGKEIPVLTTLNDGSMAFRIMRNIRKTQESAETIKVTVKAQRRKIITYSSFVLTPNHNLFLVNGTKIQAKDLKIGDRLESVYRHKANSKGYLALQNSVETDMEHRIVASYNFGERPKYPEFHVDHIDENKQNNLPFNLQVLPADIHNRKNMCGDDNPARRFPEHNYFVRGEGVRCGSKNGMFGVRRFGSANPAYGRKHTEEEKEKMRIARRKHKETKVVNHKVIAIEPCQNVDVYNASVDDTQRYYVEIADGEGILSSNCSEEFLENFNNCCLGSINLTNHFKKHNDSYVFDYDLFAQTIKTAVRFLDDVITVNQFPFPKLREVNLATRRIGLGIMGWADSLFYFNAPYDSEEALKKVDEIGKFLLDNAWAASAELAKERGPFPEYERSALKTKGMPPVRNSSVITAAPTGTISRIANCSSGIEPYFNLAWKSNILWKNHEGDNTEFVDAPTPLREILVAKLGTEKAEKTLLNIAEKPKSARRILGQYGIDTSIVKTAMEIEPEAHVKMLAQWQKYVTNGVSKTINLRNDAAVDDVKRVFWLAWELGCKAVTVYRDGSKSMQVLSTGETKANKTFSERPAVLHGVTEKARTGHGNAYITINSNGDNRPLEIFTTLGKAGSCDSAYLEAISRLASTALQNGVDAKEISKQLRGITCHPIWSNGILVSSVPDAISGAMDRFFGQKEEIETQEQNEYEEIENVKARCPECGGTMIRQEGCAACSECGWNKCG